MKKHLRLIITLIILAILLYPISVACDSPQGMCLVPHDDGSFSEYYAIEPLGIYLIESITSLSIPLHYSSRINTYQLPQ